MKIIILIIASDFPLCYIDMQNIWRSYGNSHPNIRSYFIKMDIGLVEDILVDESQMTICR